MKRVRIFWLSLLLVFPCMAQQTVTLEQCREWARMNYPLIHRYGLIDQTEQYSLSNAGKNWLPQISINGKATYQSEVTKLPFDAEKISSLIPGFDIPTVSKDQYQVMAELNQTIWDGGAIRSAREITRAEATANRKQVESDLYALNERVDQLYFGSLLIHELLKQNQLLQKELTVNIERIDAMMANGVANQSDRESLLVELLNAQQKETEINVSSQAYKQMLGVFISHSLESAVLERPALPGLDYSGAINRPELKAFDAHTILTDAQNQQINAGLMPRVGAFIQGGYGRPGLNMLEDSFNPFYIAGIRFSWNLGSLYTLKNDRRKIETNLRNIAVQKETFLFNTRLQLIQQDSELRKIRQLMESDDEIIRLRNNIKRASEVKLENGVISVTDLIREINAEDMARQTAATRQIEYLMAAYKYLVISGE